jgi:hypothetical protein
VEERGNIADFKEITLKINKPEEIVKSRKCPPYTKCYLVIRHLAGVSDYKIVLIQTGYGAAR